MWQYFSAIKKGQQTLTSDMIYFFRSDFSRHMTNGELMDGSKKELIFVDFS
jgi:hypothetical protein